MFIRTEYYRGFELALKRENDLYKVDIIDPRGNAVSFTFQNTEAQSALAEAKRIVDGLLGGRKPPVTWLRRLKADNWKSDYEYARWRSYVSRPFSRF